jgi:hypothetical protein
MDPAEQAVTMLQTRGIKTIVSGALAAGLLDGLDAVFFIGWFRGAHSIRVFQFIASGLLGVKAFDEGSWAAALGVGLHFLISFGVASSYYALSSRFPALLRRPLLFGPIFGLAVFLIMHYLIVPMSAAPKQPPAALPDVLNLLLSHTLFVGLPIALIASRQQAFAGQQTQAADWSRT